jgi:hypothetical protein
VRNPRISVTLGLVAGLLAASGCGGSSSKTDSARSTATAAAALPASTGATRPAATASTHAQFAAFAHAVNLRLGDLPGFRVEAKNASKPRVPHAQLAGLGDQFKQCAGILHLDRSLLSSKPLVKVKSSTLASGNPLHKLTASSEVEIARSPATARRSQAALRRLFNDRSARTCFARAFGRAFTIGVQAGISAARSAVRIRASVGTPRLVPFGVAAPVPGTTPGVGASFSIPVDVVASARGRTVRLPTELTLDVLAVLVGRAGVTVTTMNFGATFPAKLEAHLFSTVAARAVAASRSYPAVLR